MSDLDAIENSYERRPNRIVAPQQQQQHGDNNNDGNNNNIELPPPLPEDGITGLIRSFVESSPPVVLDDVVTIKAAFATHPKFSWLANQIGTVVQVHVPTVDPELIEFTANIQLPQFTVVEYSLLNADMSFEDELASENEADDDEGNNNNADGLLHNKDKMGIPAGAVHVALPVEVLEVRDRGISALDVVVYKPTHDLASVGGFSLRCSVMPVELPGPIAKIMRTANGGKKPQDFFEVPRQMHPILKRPVRYLHCTDLLPANPYRRTVAVVHKETLRVGFVDQVNHSIVILLDNGAVCLCDHAEDIEEQLLSVPSSSGKNKNNGSSSGSNNRRGGAAARRNRHARFAEDGDDEEEEDDEIDVDFMMNDEEEEDGDDGEDGDGARQQRSSRRLLGENLGAMLDRLTAEGDDEDYQPYNHFDPEDVAAHDTQIIQHAVHSFAASKLQESPPTEDDLRAATDALTSTGAVSQETAEEVSRRLAAMMGRANSNNNNNSADATTANNNNTDQASATQQQMMSELDNIDTELYKRTGADSDVGLPNWAFTKPQLGWLRRVKVRHSLVKKGRILIVAGSLSDGTVPPDTGDDGEADDNNDAGQDENNSSNNDQKKKQQQPKKKKLKYDNGTIICMSPESIDVRWCVPHYDPMTEPPLPEVEAAVDVRSLFAVQHFYSELMGVDCLQDVAFVRPGRKEREELRKKVESEYKALEAERVAELLARKGGAAAAATSANQSQQQQQDQDQLDEPPLLYNVQEIETATGVLDSRGMNAFYSQFVLPDTVDKARAELRRQEQANIAAERSANSRLRRRGRAASAAAAQSSEDSGQPPSLLRDERWRNFFSNLSQTLKTAVRIVDVESFHCVTLTNGEKKTGVMAVDMLRPDGAPASLFDHVTAYPRDVVTRASDKISAEAVLQQQLAQNTQSASMPHVAVAVATKQQQEQQQKQQKQKAQQQNNSKRAGGATATTTTATRRNTGRIVVRGVEECALFDITRCTYPDVDCVVSDVVTMRTRDEQAQILSLAGPLPPEIGLVRSINPTEMTARVAWGSYAAAAADDNQNDGDVADEAGNEEEDNSNSHNIDSNSSLSRAQQLLRSVAHFPSASVASSRHLADPSDTFAASFANACQDSPFPKHGGLESFMIGQVMGKISLDEVVVRWWNGQVERINPGRLSVHHFPYDDEPMEGDEELDEEEFEEVEEGEDADNDDDEAVATTAPISGANNNNSNSADEGEIDEEELVNPFHHQQQQQQQQPATGTVFNGGSNMARIPSDVNTDQAAFERFVNNVETPNNGSPPSSPDSAMPRAPQPPLPLTAAGTDSANAASAATNNTSSSSDSLVNRVISTATRTVGNFLMSMVSSTLVGNAAAQPAAASASATATQPPQQKQQHVDPTAATTAATSNTNNSNNNSNKAPLLPANSLPGTFTSCSHFVAHLADDVVSTTAAAASASADGNSTNNNFTPAQPHIFVKRLMNELKALRTSCSEMADVFIKANDDRTHTLKFAIAGGIHTPYYSGFYCFDLALTPTFPNSPPVVRFHSRNMRLNPNLYEDGLVCLSLLGTWNGQQKNEGWTPSSTLKQVMLSIQAIILCQEPFFNEPGYEHLQGTKDGAAHSKMYNEQCFLLKIAHLMHQAHQAPPDWVGEFRSHYLRHVPRMLQRYRRYIEQPDQQQQPTQDGSNTSNSNLAGAINADGLILPLSSGLKKALASRIAQLQQQYDTLSAQWKEEAAKFNAAFEDDDE